MKKHPFPLAFKTFLIWGGLLLFLFLFRLLFGLVSEFWFEDELQVYLIGLKYFTTGSWPYYGPDVTLHIQIPGALQGLLVGLPFKIIPIPEAPYFLLNLLSFSSLALLAWYAQRKLPGLSPWFVWTWTLTLPWVLHFSTHVTNPSYVLFGAVLFWVGFLETLPSTRSIPLPRRLSNAMMGFAVLWIMQVHLSWVLLGPFLVFSLYSQWKEDRTSPVVSLSALVGGGALPGLLLIPTFLKYGFAQGLGGTDSAVRFNPQNIGDFFTLLGRYLSFASFELPRFVGANTASRLDFFRDSPWLAPLAFFVGGVGLLQPFLLVILGFRKKGPARDWIALRRLALATFLLLWLFFWFSVKRPAAHTYYLSLPVVFLYSLYVWEPWLKKTFWRRFAAAFLLCGILYHAGYAIAQIQKRSLYRDRNRIVDALDAKDYHRLAERRPGTWY